MKFNELRILICDDSILARKQLSEAIDFIGKCTVQQAVDGIEASELLKKEHYNIIFMDLCMPNMDGMEVLKQVAGIKPKPYIVVVSSFCTREAIVEALGYGASDFIQKPYKQDQVIQVIESYLKKCKIER